MCDSSGYNKDFPSDERAEELSGMTSDFYDIENFNVYRRSDEEQQRQQGAVRMEPQLCTDIFSNSFLDIETIQPTNGFEYNTYNNKNSSNDNNNNNNNRKLKEALNFYSENEEVDDEDDKDELEDELEEEVGESQQQHEVQLDDKSETSSVSEAESHLNDIRRIQKRQKAAKYSLKKRPIRKEEWMVNKRKQKRNSGQEYINRNGNPVAAKNFCNKPCNCRMKCDTKFTESERKLLFDTFWDLQDFSLQNISLHGMIRAVEVAQHRDASLIRPRFKTFHYYLQPNASADQQRVCKRYFLDTFQLSHGRVYRCCSKPELQTVVDHRGKPGDDKQQRRLQRTHVQQHIEQFAMYKEKFLSSSLTIRNMYDLYVEECKAQQQLPLSQAYYHQMMDTILSVKLHNDDKQLQRRKKKALLKRLYSREELVNMLGTLLRQRRNKQLQKAG